MTRGRIAFGAMLVVAAAMVVILWPHPPQVPSHRQNRQLVLFHTLQRLDDPVIVLGDSLTEASMLPRTVCGHPIVNAGLNGASTASDLGEWLTGALKGKRAALIVVALGTNDALVPAPDSDDVFAARYTALLAQVAPLAPRRAVIGIPPVQAKERVSPEFADQLSATIARYNALLPGIAARDNAAFVPLGDLPPSATIDGVHLNMAGYRVWDAAVMAAANAICGS